MKQETIERLRTAEAWQSRETGEGYVEVSTADRADILAVLEAAQRYAEAVATEVDTRIARPVVDASERQAAFEHVFSTQRALLALFEEGI